MKGFGIYVKNDLLDVKHHEQMGRSVWLYMWLLDKITSINENGIGKVLGGKPIKAEDFAGDLQLSKKTYFRYVEKLKSWGYINTIQTPYGLSITVNKAVKVFNNRVDKTVHSKVGREWTKVSTQVDKSVHSRDKSVHSNKTIQLDKTITKQDELAIEKPLAQRTSFRKAWDSRSK